MPRASEFTGKTKKQALARSGYRCEGYDGPWRCEAPLRPGAVHYDHKTPLALGGDSSLENCQCLCPTHHAIKTAEEDIPRIRKADRQRAAIYGARTTSRPIRSRPFAKAGRQPKRLSAEKQCAGLPAFARQIRET